MSQVQWPIWLIPATWNMEIERIIDSQSKKLVRPHLNKQTSMVVHIGGISKRILV